MNGLPDKQVTIFQLSPSLGYHLTPTFSIGLGPNLLLQGEKQKIGSQWGMRSFVKNEFFNQRLYAQVEDLINFPQMSYQEVESGKFDSQHNLLIGAGYVLPFSKSFGLNSSLLYRIAGQDNVPGNINTASSPWVIRIGISSIKEKK